VSARWLVGGCLAASLCGPASAQAPVRPQAAASASSAAKKELVQKILKLQQPDIENLAHDIVERPAAQMLQQAAAALHAVPADKRAALGDAIDAAARKYTDEAYPLVRERAMRLAPLTVGPALEQNMSESELRQLAAWLESPVSRKYLEVSADIREAFVGKLLEDAQPVVDPKLRVFDERIRTILAGASAGASAPAGSTSRQRATSPGKAAASRPAGR